MHTDWAEENERLRGILDFLREYKSIMTRKKLEVDELVDYSLKHFNSDNTEQFTELTFNVSNQEYIDRKLKDTENALVRPYFARVDFTPDDDQKNERFYIGKMTLMDDASRELLITDWRAPVATLYYEGRIGRAAYDCPDGHITGEIGLKRQYVIENGELREITDIDITTNDEFLQAALGSSKDRRLKDIVTTIQAEQNQVIRGDMFRPIVVQGAAGSGKTTIALHRVAFLLYAHENRIKAGQFLIMAPNRFFLSYISDVLPDLGVERVAQTTFEEFAMGFIGQKLRVKPEARVIADIVNNSDYHSPKLSAARLKASLVYKKMLERYTRFIIKKALPEEDFALEGFVILEKNVIARMLAEDYSYLPLKRRIDELKKSLTNALRRRKPWIIDGINELYDSQKNQIKLLMPDSEERRVTITNLLDERDGKLKAVTNKSKTAVKRYLEQFHVLEPLTYYLKLFQNRKLFERMGNGFFSEAELELIWHETRASLDAKCLEGEDLPALMLLKHRMFAPEDASETRHIVIDEAQDYSLFQFSILKDILKSQSFSILGDINQGIHSYKGIEDWNDLTTQVFDEKPNFLTLKQSYRTTVEIMEQANMVIQRLGRLAAPLAVPVIRHGGAVSFMIKESLAETAASIDADIDAFIAAGYHSVAVICKTEWECGVMKKLLRSEIRQITGGETDYPGGCLIVPSYLVKGLEFDAVLIADASDENYTSEPLDVKLLYIAMTRALHELKVYALGRMTHLISTPSLSIEKFANPSNTC
ncbi:MAG: AAA family ATPase [Clostridiales bacterium]|jgi:DNA helicase-2/ATP-dependent DNA helicase PcrA|nr:AAA family ATPase [Clostridiales bacterium]